MKGHVKNFASIEIAFKLRPINLEFSASHYVDVEIGQFLSLVVIYKYSTLCTIILVGRENHWCVSIM